MDPNPPAFTCRLTGTAAEVRGGSGAEIFPYWSFTKTVLAVCALKLVEAGKLRLDTPPRRRGLHPAPTAGSHGGAARVLRPAGLSRCGCRE
nr:beta-lactamase family protein [Alloyangia mangrovi]